MAVDNYNNVVTALKNALSPTTAREATTYLTGLERTPGFGFLLLRVVEAPSNDLSIRQGAATLFKNFVKRLWDDEEAAIPVSDKDIVKSNIVRLMIASPPLVQRQLSEALAIISRVDFPEAWGTLLPELVGQLQVAADMGTTVGILETAAAVFERFRGAYDTDEVRKPLRVALDQFGVHLPAIVDMLDGRLDAAVAGGGDKAALAPILHALRVCVNIFYLLSTIDLPDVFEDKLESFMTSFHKYLDMKMPAVQAKANDDEPGPLEQLQAAVLEVIGLYSEKYDDDFTSFLDTFVRDAWGLLAGSTRERLLSQSMDGLVSSALRFLTAVAGRPGHAHLFEQEAAMRAVLEGVVLPNIRLRESDVETFEDNPIDFIRGDIEGSDADTRRRTATDLLRALCKGLNAKVTPMCTSYIDQLLALYGSDKAAREADKDAAVALVMAVAVKTSTAAAGATAVNELFSLGDFLRLHILPELQAGESVDARPIARAAAIKFVATFRTLFGQNELHALLPLLAPFTNAKSYVVHTYAAGAIERILAVKDKAADGSSTARVSIDAVAPLTTSLLASMFTRMMAASYGENEYLMKCVMRLVVFAQGRVGELSATLVSALTALLQRVCSNPSNPSFNHLLFETIAALMRSVCGVRPESVADFEALLFPPFQDVLQRDVSEFFPYVFQLLAELLELRPAPAAGQSGLTDAFRSLLPPVISPPLWLNKGNVPALTELLGAYLLRGGADIVNNGQLPAVLSIWQKLLTTKTQEPFSFALLNAAVEGVPVPALQPNLAPILQMAMSKVQELKAIRVARLFVHSFALASGLHGPGLFEGVISSFGPGVYSSVIEAVVLPMAKHVIGNAARRETAIGLTRILCESTYMTDTSNPNAARAWPQLLASVVELFGPPPRDSKAKRLVVQQANAGAAALFTEEEEEETVDSMYSAEYTVAFSRLVYATNHERYAFKGRPAPQAFLTQSLAAAAAARPGTIPALIAASPVAANVQALCASAGVVLA